MISIFSFLTFAADMDIFNRNFRFHYGHVFLRNVVSVFVYRKYDFKRGIIGFFHFRCRCNCHPRTVRRPRGIPCVRYGREFRVCRNDNFRDARAPFFGYLHRVSILARPHIIEIISISNRAKRRAFFALVNDDIFQITILGNTRPRQTVA